ncbi:MAG: Hsp20/alpha crystallin family protein [Deltaproteobacteria bacterium]|nr:Hsp20/alpha crystallin family protein [Deltaproteobacteria bacterium]MBW2417508.1 Hsp20/alpha crystallin family protein [Deltaproteobacteria bacterium]
MIPTDPENGNEKAGRTDEAATSARYFHWEISTKRAFPTARDVEQRFEERLRRWRAPRSEAPVDVFVLDDGILVQMDLPGVDESDLRARIEEDCLVVEAIRRREPPAEGARAALLERPRGPLHRRIPLPVKPGTARLVYELRSGVLLLRLIPERAR